MKRTSLAAKLTTRKPRRGMQGQVLCGSIQSSDPVVFSFHLCEMSFPDWDHLSDEAV
jgi:hypothetical protein